MTHLPNAPTVQIDDSKIRDDLLNPDNPQNQGKARRFGQYGFDRAAWQTLATALRDHPVVNPLAETIPSPHGVKYVVRCTLRSPDTRNPCMTTIWIVESGSDRPRLVTAY